MGNLYTQLVKQPNARLAILSKLKLAWKNYKVSKTIHQKKQLMTQIKFLQSKLKKIETKKKGKLFQSVFNGPYRLGT